MGDLTCDEVNDAAAGYALDILDSAQRASVAAHLVRCGVCRETVTRTQSSAAELLALDGTDDRSEGLPWADRSWSDSPWDDDDWAPAGGHQVTSGRRRFRAVMTMAAVAVLFVGTTFGPEIEQSARPTERPVATGVLLADDQPVGTVNVYGGHPPVIEIEADHLPASGTVGYEVLGGDGTVLEVGRFTVYRGQASWAGRVDEGQPYRVMLVDHTGTVVATATV